jgi:hypothetical protein
LVSRGQHLAFFTVKGTQDELDPECFFRGFALRPTLVGLLVFVAAFKLGIAADEATAKGNWRHTEWIGTWATSAQLFLPDALETYQNQTLRLIVHTNAGGLMCESKSRTPTAILHCLSAARTLAAAAREPALRCIRHEKLCVSSALDCRC